MKLVSHRGRNLSPLWSDSDLTGAAYLAALRDWDWIFESFHFMSYGAFSTRRKDWFGPTWYPIRVREASLSMDIFLSLSSISASLTSYLVYPNRSYVSYHSSPMQVFDYPIAWNHPKSQIDIEGFLTRPRETETYPGKSRKGMMKLPLRPTLSFAPFGEYSGKLVLTATWVLRSHF